VSELLGHSSVGLTLDAYSHVISSLQEEASGVIAATVLTGGLTPPRVSRFGQVRAITSGS